MTLIACVDDGISPVLFADRLLTSEIGGDVFLPTIGSKHAAVTMSGNTKVHDIARKLTIATPEILVAWAGRVTSAARVVNGISFAAKNYSDQPSVIQAYLRAEFPEELKEIVIIVQQRRPDGTTVRWTNGNGCREMHSRFARIWYAGSGAPKFEAMVQQFRPSLLESIAPTQRAATFAVAMGAQLLAEEMMTAGPLQMRFGGFYDYLLFQSKGPVWIYDITYIFWRITRTDTGYSLGMPFKFIKHIDLGRYGGDIAIYSTDVVVDGAGSAKAENEAYSISSPSLSSAVESRGGESLRSIWQAVVFIVQDNESFAMKTHVSCRPDTQGHLVNFELREQQNVALFDVAAIHDLIAPFLAELEAKR